jgi:hypothetical protein
MRDQFGGLLVALIQPNSIHAGHSRRRQNENPEDSKSTGTKTGSLPVFLAKKLRFVGNFGRVADTRSLRAAAFSLQSPHQRDGPYDCIEVAVQHFDV